MALCVCMYNQSTKVNENDRIRQVWQSPKALLARIDLVQAAKWCSRKVKNAWKKPREARSQERQS